MTVRGTSGLDDRPRRCSVRAACAHGAGDNFEMLLDDAALVIWLARDSSTKLEQVKA
jgi:hypothetical protein